MPELRIDRVMPAEPRRVWHALTNAHALAAWVWPAELGAQVTTDPQVGGAMRIASTAGTEMAVSAEYTEVQAPRRLAFSWHWDGDDTVTEATIDLAPVEGGTAMVLVHTGFPTQGDRDNHFIGWSDCLDRLEAGVATGAGHQH